MARTTQTGRRRLYPMPVEPLADSALAMTLPAAGFGMVARLILHYHASHCRPLPSADHELMHIARAHAPSWRRLKTQVMQVVNECLPDIAAYTKLRDAKGTTLSLNAQKMNSKRRLSALLDQAAPLDAVLTIPNKSDRPAVHPTPRQGARRVMTDRR